MPSRLNGPSEALATGATDGGLSFAAQAYPAGVCPTRGGEALAVGMVSPGASVASAGRVCWPLAQLVSEEARRSGTGVILALSPMWCGRQTGVVASAARSGCEGVATVTTSSCSSLKASSKTSSDLTDADGDGGTSSSVCSTSSSATGSVHLPAPSPCSEGQKESAEAGRLRAAATPGREGWV